jgi:3D (Asp-Asp-Asp) domain-containing protein
VVAGNPLTFTATAYCKGTTTAAGINVRSGIAAADPTILPLGSVVTLATKNTKYQGIYTILDTGPAVQGRRVDLYMWSCFEALAFGRQQIELTVLRLGWEPEASAPSLIDRLFPRREAARAAAPRPRQLPEPAPNSPDNTKGAKGARVRGSEGATAPSDLTADPSRDR